MTLEEKLKEVSFTEVFVKIDDAVRICQQEIDEACKKAKIEVFKNVQRKQ